MRVIRSLPGAFLLFAFSRGIYYIISEILGKVPDMGEKKFLLFDIDGTLIRTGGAGKHSMERAFEVVFGVSNGFSGIHMMGRTDPAILEEALLNHGISGDETLRKRYRDLYFRILEIEIPMPRKNKRICAGVVPLLKRLKKDPRLILGLLTGNWRQSAYIKLRHFHLDRYFKTGAFADDSGQREELIPLAISRLTEETGVKIGTGDVVVIGDTPLDIRAALPHGAKVIGVATGIHSQARLQSEQPHAVIADLTRWDEAAPLVGL
jgi:phosphoglycolate phosphatase-like HAD superfamily hydrolase